MKSKFIIFCCFFMALGLLASFWSKDILDKILQNNIVLTHYENLGKKNISDAYYSQSIKIHQECFENVRRKNLTKYLIKYGNYSNARDYELIRKKVDNHVDEQNLEQKSSFRYSKNMTLAKHKQKIVGMYNCLDENQVTHNSVMIYNVCVAKKYRGKGLGKILMQNAIQRCKKENRELTLLVYKDDIIAQNLYQKLGFKIIQPKIKADNRFEFFNKFLMVFSGLSGTK